MEQIKNKKISYWLASDFMEEIGYKDWKTFVHLMDEATKIMTILEIPYYENIIPEINNIEGKENFKLTRFACFLIVMLADRKKEKVAEAQERFAVKADQYGIYPKDFFEIERLKIREELTDANKWLNSLVTNSELNDYSAFYDAGYVGLYGMKSKQLQGLRKLPKNIGQLDFMGRTELTANLFRITLTELEIWSKKVKGQSAIEKIHYEVGKGIRKLIKEHTGKFPEQLPLYKGLGKLKKQVKAGYQKMIKIEK